MVTMEWARNIMMAVAIWLGLSQVIANDVRQWTASAGTALAYAALLQRAPIVPIPEPIPAPKPVPSPQPKPQPGIPSDAGAAATSTEQVETETPNHNPSEAVQSVVVPQQVVPRAEAAPQVTPNRRAATVRRGVPRWYVVPNN